MNTIQKKNINNPDELRNFSLGKLQLASLGGKTFGLATFSPGWKWSESVKPVVKTESCQVAHFGYQIAGKLHVVMDDGTETELVPGDISMIPPGHNAWVVGNEPVISLDLGMSEYGKKT